MEYSRIVAVTGMPGLYEILSSKTDGAIVRSLEDESTRFVSSRVHNLSHLESIEIYTTGENVSLADVFAAMKDGKDGLPDVKDNKALKAYFEKTYPEMDTERVYASDMKKMVNWFTVLQKHKVDYSVKPEPEEEEAEVETKIEKEPKAKAATKKVEAKSAAEKEQKEAPAKKTASAKKETGAATVDTDTKESKEPAKKKAAPAKKKKSEE
jgi:hypothetical protein